MNLQRVWRWVGFFSFWLWWVFKRACFFLGVLVILFWCFDFFTTDETELLLEQIQSMTNNDTFAREKEPECYQTMKDYQGECISITAGEGRTP